MVEVIEFAWHVPMEGLACRDRKPDSEGAGEPVRLLSWPVLEPYFRNPYRPLEEHPTLFRILADVEPTEEGCLEFAGQYGSLGRGPTMPSLASDLTVFQVEGSEHWYAGETLARWKRDIEWMSLAVRVCDAWQAKNRSRLLSVLKEAYPLAQCATYEDAAKEPFRAARLLLHHVFSDFLPRVGLSVDRKLRRVIQPASLRDALWLQFQSSIEEGRVFARCEYCRSWFWIPPQTAGRKRFCRDSCRVGASKRRSRKQRNRRRSA